jgi:hypothetical protein
MQYTRVYADDAGESHFEDVVVPMSPVTYAPPAPPVDLSTPEPASAVVFLSAPPGWDGDWHPSPRRQLAICLAGEVEVEMSDGKVRRFGPSAVTLSEETTGKGHRSRIGGELAALLAVMQLAD